jgi:hypothetical protein
MMAMTDLIPCHECDRPVSPALDEAYDLLYGPTKLEASRLAYYLERELRAAPEATNLAVLMAALEEWLGCSLGSLVDAVRHYLTEEA